MGKAQGLPMNTIVIIALALIVLVVIGVFFFTGMGRQSALITQQVGAATGGEKGLAKAECQSLCTSLAFTSISGDCTAANLGNYPEIVEYCCKECHLLISCSVTVGGSSCSLNDPCLTVACPT